MVRHLNFPAELPRCRLVEGVDIGSLEPIGGNTECPGAQVGDLRSSRCCRLLDEIVVWNPDINTWIFAL